MCVRRRKLFFVDRNTKQILSTDLSQGSRTGSIVPLSDMYPALSSQSQLADLYPGRLNTEDKREDAQKYFTCSPTSMMVFCQDSGSLSILSLPFECQFKLSSTPEQHARVASAWTSSGWWINVDSHGNLNAYNIGRLEGDDEGAEVKKVRFELGQTSLLTGKKISLIAVDRSARYLILCLLDEVPTASETGEKINKFTLYIMELGPDGPDSLDLSYMDELEISLDVADEIPTHLDGSMQLENESFLVNCFTSAGRLVSCVVNSTGKPKLMLSELLVDGKISSVRSTGNSLAVTLVPRDHSSTETLFFMHLDAIYNSSKCLTN